VQSFFAAFKKEMPYSYFDDANIAYALIDAIQHGYERESTVRYSSRFKNRNLRNVKLFRGWLVCKAHRWYHSTLGSKVIDKKKKVRP